MVQESINPHNNQLLSQHPLMEITELESLILQSSKAQKSWMKQNISVRSEQLLKLSVLLKENGDDIARLITLEMGKPIREARAEVEKSIWCIEYYAQKGEGFLSKENVSSEAFSSYVRKDPLGIILGVMPWNFPLWQVIRFAIPAIISGNSVLLKHSSNVPQCSLKIEELFLESGLPENIFLSAITDSSGVEYMLRNPLVSAVSVTGGKGAGSAIGSLSASLLKKCVMELGGSDPFILFADADLSSAVEGAVSSRFRNSGQSCIASKRFIVEEKIYDRFMEHFIDGVNALKMGDPLDEDTDIGPLATAAVLESIDHQIQLSIKMGARAVVGSTRVEGEGNYYNPTVLVDVNSTMPVMGEETFGPVAAVTKFKEEYEAVLIANDTEYGLGASIWSRDHERAERLISQIDAGSIFVNNIVRSDPRLPFGGVKSSGYGRELGAFGIHEFLNIKSVWID